jgi:hypothetical protein
MISRLLARSMVLFSMLWSVATFAAVTPYPSVPGSLRRAGFDVSVPVKFEP